jgi:hypothetical protein
MKKTINLKTCGMTAVIMLMVTWAEIIIAGDTSGNPPCVTCEELMNIDFPEVTIIKTENIDEDKPYCKVLGTIGKEINFELLLPETWNSRFVMGGGGGFVGNIQNVARMKVKDGYATVGTDTGHKGDGLKADWAFNNMERQVNFGHMAVHRTTVVARSIINHYYGTYPEYSYFIGCSRGGGQAMMEAQRYPEDFDGIVAGAPAFSWPATAAEFIQNMQTVYPDPDNLDQPVITRANLQLLQELVLEKCDELDGVRDGIINDPRECDFNLEDLPVCRKDEIRDDCFTPEQVKAIRMIYEGVIVQGEVIYPGFPYGGENEKGGWYEWIVGPNERTLQRGFPSLQFGFGTEMFKYLIFQDPDFDYSTYNFENFKEGTGYASSYLDATSTNYTTFKDKGGKMIFYHGWNDAALSAFSTIDHYDGIRDGDEDIEDYIRLFLLPGVLHCGGGPGPDNVNWLELVRDWVENGKAPEKVTLVKFEKGKEVMTRPVYPYPSKAVYKGKGDPDKEKSYRRETP